MVRTLQRCERTDGAVVSTKLMVNSILFVEPSSYSLSRKTVALFLMSTCLFVIWESKTEADFSMLFKDPKSLLSFSERPLL